MATRIELERELTLAQKHRAIIVAQEGVFGPLAQEWGQRVAAIRAELAQVSR